MIIPDQGFDVAAATVARSGLRQQPPGEQHVGHAQSHQQIENPAPAQFVGQQPAENRGDARAQGYHQIHHRQPLRRLPGRGGVADDGPRQRQAGATAQGLKQTRGDQRLGFRGQGRGQSGQGVQAQAHHQHRPAAEVVGQRPIDQLPHGEAENIKADGHLHGAGGGIEVVASQSQGRHEDVHRQGAAEGQ